MIEENRRRSLRTPVEGLHASGALRIGNDSYPVLICDESVDGIGIVAVNLPSIADGTEVVFESTVRHVNGRIGSVRYTRIAESDVYRIGLKWSD